MNPIRLQRAGAVIVRTAVTYLVSLSVIFSPLAAHAEPEAGPRNWPTPKEMVDRPVTGQSREGEILAEIPIGVGSDGEGKVLPSVIGRKIMKAAAENAKLDDYISFSDSFAGTAARSSASETLKSASAALKTHGKLIGSAAKRSAVGLPASQAMFVTTMAIAGYPMISSALVNDPLAWQRTLVDPWMATGLAGFYALMATQGYTEAALHHHFPKKAGRYLFPSTAMGVGMGMSIYVANIMTDPNVALCTKLMFGALELPKEMAVDQAQAELKRRRAVLFERAGVDVSTDPCDRAYEHLIIHQKLWEMAPQLTSVVTTALIMAFGQKHVIERIAASTLKSGVQSAGKVVVKWALELIPLVLNPAGAGTKMVITAALKTKPLAAFLGATAKQMVHLAAFIQIDHFINPYILGSLQSVGDGVRITNIQSELQTDLESQGSKLGWSVADEAFTSNDLDSTCVEEFKAEKQTKAANGVEDQPEDQTELQKCWRPNHLLRRLNVKMVDWRKKILSKPLTAYQAWEDFLQKFLSLQSGTKFFYRKFLEKKAEIDGGAFDVFKDSFATYGLRRLEGAGKAPAEYLDNPDLVKKEQVAYAAEVGKRYLKKTDVYRSITQGAGIHALTHLASGEYDRVVKGIAILRWMKTHNNDSRTFLGIPELGVPPTPIAPVTAGRRFDAIALYGDQLKMTYEVLAELGEPMYLVEPGRGAMYIMREIDEVRSTFNKMESAIENMVPLMPKYNSFGQAGKSTSKLQKYAVNHIADKLLVQMACGTDPVKENVPLASWTEGYRAEFYPPSIVEGVDEIRKQLCTGRDRESIEQLYTAEITVKGKKYKGIVDVIRNNLREEVNTPEKFDAWWTANVDPKMEDVYKQFRYSYNGVVKMLHQTLMKQNATFSPENVQSWFNIMEVASDGVLENLEQELKFNLAVLGDIYAEAIAKKTGTAAPRSLYGVTQKQSADLWCRTAKCSRLVMFQKSNHLTFAPRTDKASTEFANLHFQDEVLKAFGDMRSQLMKVKWSAVMYKDKPALMVKSEMKQSELKALFNLFEILVEEKISMPMDLPAALTSASAASQAQRKRILTARQNPHYFTEIKNPVTKALAQTARDNVQGVLSELRNYASILTMASLEMGEKSLEPEIERAAGN